MNEQQPASSVLVTLQTLARGDAALAALIRPYFGSAAEAALSQRSPAALLAIAAQHRALAAQRAPGQVLVQVLAPAADSQDGLSQLYTCTDDMPFLVDTVSMAVREAGSTIDWAIHPVLTGQAGAAESWIHLQFEALADEAAHAALKARVEQALTDLRTVVADFETMNARALALAKALDTPPVGTDAADCAEAAAFLRWLADGHFTFLGYAETRLTGGSFVQQPTAALGLSKKGARFSDPEELIAPSSELDKYAESPRQVVITKAALKSPLRHPEYMDVISFKLFDAQGRRSGTARLLGLFSSEAYLEHPRSIPLIRRKLATVLARAGLSETGHSGKNLKLILSGLPRDELFQSGEEELFATATGIRALRDRAQLKLFLRRDRYGRFFSCLVYVPRERYSRELRDRIAEELRTLCGGHAADHSVEFAARGGALARIHCVVRTAPGTVLSLPVDEIERRLAAATRSWRDQLRSLLLTAADAANAARYGDAFPLAYTEALPAEQAAADVPWLARLSTTTPLLPRLGLDAEGRPQQLTLFALAKPVGLSDVLPMLENFGLRVARQTPVEVRPRGGEAQWMQSFELQGTAAGANAAAFEAAFLACWAGETENDGLNRLVLGANLSARQVTALRLITKYLIQTGLPYSQGYMEQLLGENAAIARLLVQLFEARFDPQRDAAKRAADEIIHAQALDAALDKVASLDGDRVLRAYLSVLRAGLRTNFYLGKPVVSLKLDPSKVPELPLPRPLYEIFVYSPEVEGIHLRGGRVARGGLRWSDRRQDFRTEVLGLMKAQQVKNTVIVPVGAKGGFVVKRGNPAVREEWQKAGVACYQTFLRALLDITDNRVGGAVVPPKNVVRHDGDDPYFVVAADKGTATFSDIANAISAEYHFWMGDAFASGGSVGYDHKKMGITAKGGWESVKRHFREMGRNTQAEPFSVVGVGDMSGDVFGNGMLLSPHIRLLAAFDHRHIFIDPNPDCAKSFAERARLFALPRSSWDDYDKTLLSEGGGVVARSAKSIKLSPAAQAALGLSQATFTPNELMHDILKAPVDLLWNGGIGTYVKASTQAHPDCGDRANDALRVNGRELRCKVVGEGGNLGMTQLGRVEAALNGVRLNTDAIDNAGGVHSSDREVNIKIPLNELMAAGTLDRATRDPLLASMTDDIARFVLRDNEVQCLAVSLLEQSAPARLDEHANLIRTLERDGLLNRAIEFLPDDEAMKERRTQGRGLTRPELAVLLAYSKISMKQAMLESSVPDDPFFERDLLANFPPLLVQRHGESLKRHQLKREIIATLLTNAVVNRMGLSFSHRMAEDHGVQRAEIIKAYAAAHQIYDGDRYWRAIEALDNQVPARVQYKLFERACGLLKHATGWLVNTRAVREPIGALVARHAEAVKAGEGLLPAALPKSYREDWDRAVAAMQKDGVPQATAHLLASSKVLGSALDIVELSHATSRPLTACAEAYFAVGEHFRLPWVLSAITNLAVQGRWQALARANLRDDTFRVQRLITERVLRRDGADAAARLESWLAANTERVRFAEARLSDLATGGVVDFMGLVVAVRELRKLRSL